MLQDWRMRGGKSEEGMKKGLKIRAWKCYVPSHDIVKDRPTGQQ